jgi:hypothetical protein
MANLLGRIGSFWRARIGGAAPRTYDAACEELGGVPWRMKPEATDRWFVHHRSEDEGEEHRPETLDVPPLPSIEATMRVRRRSARRKLMLAGSAAVIVIVGCVITIASGTHAQPALPLPTAALAPALSTHVSDPAPSSATALVSPSAISPSLSAIHQPSSPKLAAIVRTAPARTAGAAHATSLSTPASKPHLRALTAKRPLAGRSRRR